MNKPPVGFILAAGYGTRLAPITDHLPKPLLPIGGRPLLDRIIETFDQAGLNQVAINTHHLPEQIEAHISGRVDAGRFTLFREAEILGTGGALDGARSFLSQTDFFILHNGDVLCDVDLNALAEQHQQSGALATLVLVDWPAVNSVTLADDGTIAEIAGRPDRVQGGRRLTYAGIGAFNAELLADIKPGFSSLIDPLVRAMSASPGCVAGFAPTEICWSDLGTLPRYLNAVDNTPSAAGAPVSLEAITGHGSDRRFWRFQTPTWSAVAMQSPPQDDEFDRLVQVNRFLHAHDLGAPEVLSVDAEAKTVLMEDLGAQSLKSISNGPKATEAYAAVVDHLVKFQAATASAKKECPSAVDRILDYDVLRWETDYFRERFLVGHLALAQTDLRTLDDEFHNLATACARQPLVLLHRDFQSENILLQGNKVRLVDCQGLRLGPLTYDLMSLLLDAYVDLSVDQRLGLVTRYAHGLAQWKRPPGGSCPSLEQIQAMAVTAGLQRVMQALGAFGFLGHVKGKSQFLEHIPRGVANLKGLLTALTDLNATADPMQQTYLPGAMPVLQGLDL